MLLFTDIIAWNSAWPQKLLKKDEKREKMKGKNRGRKGGREEEKKRKGRKRKKERRKEGRKKGKQYRNTADIQTQGCPVLRSLLFLIHATSLDSCYNNTLEMPAFVYPCMLNSPMRNPSCKFHYKHTWSESKADLVGKVSSSRSDRAEWDVGCVHKERGVCREGQGWDIFEMSQKIYPEVI